MKVYLLENITRDLFSYRIAAYRLKSDAETKRKEIEIARAAFDNAFANWQSQALRCGLVDNVPVAPEHYTGTLFITELEVL